MSSFTANGTKLGFIGLGSMGSRVLARLLAAGYEVSVFRRNQAKRAALEAKGASQAGVEALDVAISGSTPAAEQGTLTLLAGGSPDVFRASQPIFQAIAAKYFHLGPAGAGTTMKMVVNAILGNGMQAIAEAAAMGEKAGLSREILLQVLSQTAVVAPAHLGKISRAARGRSGPQFPLPLMNKDFRLILQLAGEVDAAMPATSAAFQVSTAALNRYADLDFSAVMKYMQQPSAREASSISTTG